MYPPQPSYGQLFSTKPVSFFSPVRTYFHFWKYLLIYDHLWESFLNHNCLWKSSFFLSKSIFNCVHLFISVRTYDHLQKYFLMCSHLWESIFLSPYENKQAYEYHHLKQNFYHQNTIMIFCWFRIFQFYVFYFEFFSF